MERHAKKGASVGGARPVGTARVVHDRYWERELRSAVLCGALLFGLLALLDWGLLVGLTGARTALWAALALLLLVILTPPRVSATDDGLDARGFLTHHRVRTDQLVTVQISEGVAQRLVLSDTSGARLVLDPRVLVANPLLWHALDQGARRSLERGTLRSGAPVLERLGHRVDAEAWRGIARAAELE
ncbi:hypothetical protein [Streptomyces sp. NPDC002845]